jgi:predicted DCC family thiol-disulfide oxidoreductase YuxK
MNSPVILFDGVCNLCNSSVRFIIENDPKEIFLFSSLQSAYSRTFLLKHQLPADNLSSIILIIDHTIYKKSEAVFKIIQFLPKYRWLSFFSFLPLIITDFFYDIIAKYRYVWFGKNEFCNLHNMHLSRRFL